MKNLILLLILLISVSMMILATYGGITLTHHWINWTGVF